jgi:hypothetical protein
MEHQSRLLAGCPGLLAAANGSGRQFPINSPIKS